MKALSVKQPFASMIASGEKTIETRTWKTKYRGDLLIVASRLPEIDGLPTGKALCVVKLVACRPMTWRDEKAACCNCYHGAHAWVLRDVKKIEPFPVRGQLYLYDVEVPFGALVKGDKHEEEKI